MNKKQESSWVQTAHRVKLRELRVMVNNTRRVARLLENVLILRELSIHYRRWQKERTKK